MSNEQPPRWVKIGEPYSSRPDRREGQTFGDPAGWWRADVWDDGTVILWRYADEPCPLDRQENDRDNPNDDVVLIQDLGSLILRLRELHATAETFFGHWPG